MNNKGKGLLALLGLGAGAFAFWKYKKLPPEKKEELKAQINDTGRKLKDEVRKVEESLGNKFEELKNSAEKNVKDISR